MKLVHRPWLSLALSMSVLAGCSGTPAALKPGGGKPVASHAPAVTAAAGAALIGLDGSPLIGHDGASLIGHDGASLIHQDGAGLIHQDGAGIAGTVSAPAGLIGHDGASLIGHDGASLIGHDGASVIASGGGNAVSEMGGLYHTLALEQAPLAKAHLYLRTADGRYVTDAAGNLLTAVTDAQGRYSFPGLKASSALEVVAALSSKGSPQFLRGLITSDAASQASTDLDLISTLCCGYVVDDLLAPLAAEKRQSGLNGLPSCLAVQALGVLGAATGGVPAGLTGLGSGDIASAVEALRKQDTAVDGVMSQIAKVITVAGVDSTAACISADKVALVRPGHAIGDAAGNIYVTESLSGVLRKIAPDGSTVQLLGPGSTVQPDKSFAQLYDLTIGPKDGKLYFGSRGGVSRMNLDGTQLEALAGGGSLPFDPDPLKVQLNPVASVAFDRSGDLYLADLADAKTNPDGSPHDSTLLRLDLTTRRAEQVALPANHEGGGTRVLSLAFTPDDALWLMDQNGGLLWRRDPASKAWRMVNGDDRVAFSTGDGLAAMPDNSVTAGNSVKNQVLHFTADGKHEVVAGSGAAGADDGPAASATFAQPGGVSLLPDGGLLVADSGNALIRRIEQGRVATVAGTRGAVQEGGALVVTLNLPGSIATDADGNVIVAEIGSGTIKRLEGGQLVRIAGTSSGFGGDGGPALQAKFDEPVGMAIHGKDICVSEQNNHDIRRFQVGGNIETLVGPRVEPTYELPHDPAQALSTRLVQVGGLAYGPDGLLYFTDEGRIFRLEADGSTLTRIVGSPDALGTAGYVTEAPDGQPAVDLKVRVIGGVAFSPSGELYFALVDDMRVVRVDKQGVCHTVAGVGLLPTLDAVLTGVAATQQDVPAAEAVLMLPGGLCFDAAGNLYVGEGGTNGASDFGAGKGFGDTFKDVPPLDGRIRVITTDGRARTLAGTGGPAGAGRVARPIGVAIDGQGRVVFADGATSQLKVLSK